MIAPSSGPRKPRGSRPPPSHSSSSSSSGSLSQSISGSRPAVPYSENGGVYEPSTGSDDHSSLVTSLNNLEIAQPIPQPYQNPSLNAPIQPTSRSTTPKPKLSLLKTGGGALGSIGAPDPEVFDTADVPALPPLRSNGPSLGIQLGLPVRQGSMPQSEDSSYSRPTLKPPPIGGGSKRRGPLLAIPKNSSPMGAIGADEPDALDLIEVSESHGQSNGGQPGTPLTLGGDDGEVTVRPALPQGHSQARSLDL
ncbi:5784_t:CDS:1, partial [Acaulospora colombiana]